MPDIFADLEKLNFSTNESKVYISLLNIGPSLAGRIAKETRLDRSSTYNALKMLIERGIISTVHENKRTIFVPSDPKKIIDYYKEKEEIAGKIIPDLQAKFKATKEKKNLLLFRGFKGLKTIFQDILDNVPKNKDYFIMGSEGKFSQMMPYYSSLFSKLKTNKHIHTKMLIREGRVKTDKSKLTEYKKIPSDVISPATINIYDGKVAIFIWDETPEAILIENKDVSETFKSYFNFIWNRAKK